MIELPRAAITADEIGEVADFFSFGTNDLTQTTFGFSRDDIESKFLPRYLERKVLPSNPFETIDEGVAKLVAIGCERGRAANPKHQAGRLRRARRRPRVGQDLLRDRPGLRVAARRTACRWRGLPRHRRRSLEQAGGVRQPLVTATGRLEAQSGCSLVRGAAM